MICEILSTGEEIRSGEVVDTNAAYISSRLHYSGVSIGRHTCVGDRKDFLTTVIQEIAKRAEICIVTGGLGPTSDDVTADAAAAASEVPMHFDPGVYQDIKAYFEKKGREMNPSNKKQAYFPESSTILKNPVGTAPGFFMTIEKCTFYFLPGVPSEMKIMFDEQVLSHIMDMPEVDHMHIKTGVITVFGLGESEIHERIIDFHQMFPEVDIGFRAFFPYIFVKFWTRGSDKHDLETQISAAMSLAESRYGGYLVSNEGRLMEDIAGNLLLEKKATLAVAESCTGGLISHKITNVSGSSSYFLFSGITYADESKVKVLGVRPETLLRYGAVHEQTAMEMASGVQRLTGSTFAVSTTGIAGPSGGSPEKPVGTVCVGIASSNGRLHARRFSFQRLNRKDCKEIFAVTALDLLRKELLNN